MHRVLCLTLASLMVGCSSIQDNPIYGDSGLIRDRSKEYAYAEPGKRLQLPEHLNAKATRDGLIVPEINSPDILAEVQLEVPRPEFFFASSGTERASVRPLEGERVILVDEPIARVWNELDGYWREADIAIAQRDVRAGTMETDWIVVEGEDLNPFQRVLNTIQFESELNEPSSNKLRVRVRPDPDDFNRTAISLEQVQYPLSEQPALANWDEDAAELDFSNEILFSMLQYMSRGDEADAPTLSQFQADTGPVLVVGSNSRNQPLLNVKAPIEESWSIVNAALNNAEIDVGTRDVDRKKIYLTYLVPYQEEEWDWGWRGVWEWLTAERDPITFGDISDFISEDDPEANVVYSSDPNAPIAGARPTQEELQKMDGFKIWAGGRVLYVFGMEDQKRVREDGIEVEVKRYQLVFNRARTGVLISVHNDKGEQVSEAAAEGLLWAIKDHLVI